MSRILEISGSAAGGVRTHIRQCASLMAQNPNQQVMLAAPRNVLAGDPLPGVKSRLLEIGPQPSSHDVTVLRELRWLAGHSDVVHAHGIRAGALCALALTGMGSKRPRLVITEHNLPVGSFAISMIGATLERIVACKADAVLCVSPDLAKRAKNYGARQVEIAMIPAANMAAKIGAELPLPDSVSTDTHLLLTVARLAPQKGLQLLLEAAAQLQQGVLAGEVPAFHWLVAGAGPQHDDIQTKIAADGLPVTLLGRRGDTAALMRRVDVVVQTSVWEGQPLTIQEALQVGAAVVATDVGGTAITAHGGATLVPPRAEYLADAVQYLLQNPAAWGQARQRARRASAELPTTGDLQRQLTKVLLS